MAERDEVRILGKSVDDGEHHSLAADAREPLDEVQRNISPN
jgi:hypothetical protein